MGSIFKRGDRYYVSFKDSSGKWRQAAANTSDETKAQRLLAEIESRLEAERHTGEGGPVTVRGYAKAWLARRREKHDATLKRFKATGAGKVEHRDWKNDEGRMRTHVLSSPLASMPMADVRPKHLAEWMHALRVANDLSTHTVRNVYGLLTAMFRDAAVAGVVSSSPCILTRAQLGDEDPEAPGAGRYTREQFEHMISSPRLPENARVLAALGGLAGLRLGAIAGLRWRDLDTTVTPLWRLTSSRTYDGQPTKTGKPSVIPVHPILAGMLARWRGGWAAMLGREPTPDEPIVPQAPDKWIRIPGAPHTKKSAGVVMDTILEELSIPAAPMKTHALRSTFISIALEDGARGDLIEKVTHTTGRARSAFARYDRADYWPQICAEVVKIKLSVPESLWKPFGSGLEVAAPTPDSDWLAGECRPGHQALGATPGATIHVLRPVQASPSSTPSDAGSKGLWNSKTTSVAVAVAPDPVASALEVALVGWRDGQDRRALRRALARLLADLDE